MNTNRIGTLILLITITLSVIGFTYGAWKDRIQIEGDIKMACIEIGIISEKVLMSKDVQKYSSVSYEVSPDRHVFSIYSENLKPCWYIWVGLVIQNQGELPGSVKPPEYSFEGPDGFEDYFETTEYFYGPYPENTGFGTLETWGKVKIGENLKSDGTVDFTTPSVPTPFTLDPTEKTIIWLWIHCKLETPSDAQGKTVTLYIKIVDDIAI